MSYIAACNLIHVFHILFLPLILHWLYIGTFVCQLSWDQESIFNSDVGEMLILSENFNLSEQITRKLYTYVDEG